MLENYNTCRDLWRHNVVLQPGPGPQTYSPVTEPIHPLQRPENHIRGQPLFAGMTNKGVPILPLWYITDQQRQIQRKKRPEAPPFELDPLVVPKERKLDKPR